MSHVFISYSKQNKDYARKLADYLLNQGFNVWIDDQIEPSDEWWKTVVKAIRECTAFLVIMTPQSGASRWVEREVMLADELQKPMFPVLLDGDLHASELWALFFGKQYEDVRGGTLPAERFSTKLERFAPRRAEGGADVTAKPDSNLRDWLPNFDTYERDIGVSNPTTTSEKPSGSGDGWTPDFDQFERVPEVPPQTVADFTRRHQAFLQERREQQAANPPDVTHILPPPFEWCEIPAGKVTIEYSETDHQTFTVPQFWMAKYPITNAQYQVFVDAGGGYLDPAWWGFSDEAKLWRREHQAPQKTAFEGDVLPRTNVTWFEAVAFCRWLTGRLMPSEPDIPVSLTGSTLVMLPTEQQWQRAAQGDDGRKYPWGNEFDPTRCNTQESGIWKPTTVTQYPNGVSPFGGMDMSGNVWEWCLSQWNSAVIDLQVQESRVMRGGVFVLDQRFARTECREHDPPEVHASYLGFRVACLKLGIG